MPTVRCLRVAIPSPTQRKLCRVFSFVVPNLSRLTALHPPIRGYRCSKLTPDAVTGTDPRKADAALSKPKGYAVQRVLALQSAQDGLGRAGRPWLTRSPVLGGNDHPKPFNGSVEGRAADPGHLSGAVGRHLPRPDKLQGAVHS